MRVIPIAAVLIVSLPFTVADAATHRHDLNPAATKCKHCGAELGRIAA
jgi:hypothetical protein